MTLPAQLAPDELARLTAIRARAIRDAEDFVRSHIWALEDAAINTLGQIYLDAYRSMYAALTEAFLRYGAGETWAATDARFRERTEYLLSQIRADVERLTDRATAAAFDAAIRGYQAGFYGRAWVLETGLRTGALIDLPLLPVEAIRAAMLAPYLGGTFLDRFAQARDEFVMRIRRSIVESQIRGESIYQAQKRLAAELGINISRATRLAREANQALFARTEMIARTEILRASNLGALSIYEANRDVLEGWQWTATHDERTCPICGALDGQQFAFNAPQSPPPTGSHVRCRCSVTPVLINSALEQKIVGPRQTYTEWAEERGITIINDGGVLRFRGAPPPKSPSDAAKQAAPHLYPKGA